MKKRSFRSTFVSVILVITVAISIVNLAVYGINIKKIRQVEVLKMKTAGERIDDMITISLNNIKGLKQICCTDNYARNILLKNNEKNDIGTKFENQNYMDNALKHIASMDTLILRAIDFYFVHWPDVNTPIDETMAALEEMKRKGYIRYVGVSNFTAEQIKEAEQYIQIDVQQPLYSMVDRGFEDLMSWGYDRGIDSMTYGSMGAGILSGKIRSVPSFEKNDLRLNFYDVYKEPKFSKIMELLKVMDSIADGHNVPVGQVALNWSTQKEYVGTALVGVRSIEHADENCKTFDWKLTEEEMKILDSKIEECAL